MTIRVTTLSNGLRVATDTMPDMQTVSLGVWVGVGTRNEHASVNGVAHLVEHMLFKGTERRTAFRISEEIENVGGQLNAYTTREHTAYYGKVLHEDTALALDIIADMLQHSRIDEGELARERAVVLQEIGQADDTPDDIIFDLFQETAFPNQAIGRPVLGMSEIVGALPRSALVDYIGGHYGGATMVVVAAGRVEHERFLELAAKAFADLPAVAPRAAEPARYAGGEIREERDLEQLHLVLGFDGVPVHDPDFHAAAVFSTLLGGGMSSRLFQEVREKRGLVYSIYSFSGSYQDGGVFGVYAGTGENEIGELVPVVCDELVKVADSVTEDEVARARAQLRAGTFMSLEGTMSRCEQLGQQLLIYGRPIPVEETAAQIAAVDREAIVRVARRLIAGKPTLAALGPTGRMESYDRIAARLR
jgi:predicted Zn-dependent peptidase